MENILKAQKNVYFLDLVNEILIKKEFATPSSKDEIGRKEKVVGIATDYEKAIYTAKTQIADKMTKITEEIQFEKVRPDISSEEKEKNISKFNQKLIRENINLRVLKEMFWASISSRLIDDYNDWDSFGIRKDWQIVGFDEKQNEKKEEASFLEKILISQNDSLFLGLLNQTYIKCHQEGKMYSPDESLTENETVVGEANEVEKILYNLLVLNHRKKHEIEELLKQGEDEDECLYYLNVNEQVDNIANLILRLNFLNRFKDLSRCFSAFGLRKNWKIVFFNGEK